MAIRFECSDCGKSLRVKDEFAGKKLRCPECETVLKIPAADADDEGEAEFFDDDDEEQDKRAASRRTQTARSSKSASTSARSGPVRKKRSDEGENYFRRTGSKKSKKPKAANSNAVLIWSIAIGGGVFALAAVGVVVMIVMNMGSSAGRQTTATAQGQPAAAKNHSQYVTVETDTPVSKFKMVWDMPAKWTQQSGVEDGFWPWAEMKGQGQTMKITSNRSLTEASSTMTTMGGFEETLKTAHTVRLAKLKLEYNDFEEGPLNIHEGKYGPVVWSEYEYKGMFGKGYGIRCTLPGPRLPCTLVMEYSQSARDEWRPVVLDVAGSVHFERTKKDGDDGDDDDFFMDVGGADLGGAPDE